MGLFCLLGIHSWGIWITTRTTFDERDDVPVQIRACKSCHLAQVKELKLIK